MDLSQLQPIDAKQSVDATAVISEETTDSGDVVETEVSALRDDRPSSDSPQAAVAESAAKDAKPGPNWSAAGGGAFVIGLQCGEYVGEPVGKCETSELYALSRLGRESSSLAYSSQPDRTRNSRTAPPPVVELS
jgi:hypothetical protein